MATKAKQAKRSPQKRATASQASASSRLSVMKTYKLYIKGKFPRTESGRYDVFTSADDTPVANICRGSRKDVRDAVCAARDAAAPWSKASSYLRGQILYRIAEILEGRRDQFEAELVQQGARRAAAASEVTAAIDRLVYYAGWSDKMQQIFSAVNPVSSAHFNFSMCEATGVVAIIAPGESGLLGLVSNIAPAIVAGNSCVVLASSQFPLTSITFAEVLNSSDVPAGVVNILTGHRSDLLSHFASHMDVNALVYCGNDVKEIKAAQLASAENVKRAVIRRTTKWNHADAQSPYMILDTQEIKTTWHPIGN
jgi:acyl-CoA reductase-like NAD-dependent aldehyde dehydrogenase